MNGNGKPGAPRIADTVLHANGLAKGSRKRQQQRSLGCARDDDTRGGIVSHGQGRVSREEKEPLVEVQDRASRRDISLCGGMKADAGRLFPTCHFERKREIFFVCGETVYACERKWEACLSMDCGYGVSCKRISRAGEEEDCNKDCGLASYDDTGEAVQISNPIPHPCFQT